MVFKGKNKKDNKKDTYVVEEILGKKILHKNWHYEVKWLGWEETTWEPVTNFVKLEVAKKFEASLQTKDEQSQDKENDARSTTSPKPLKHHHEKSNDATNVQDESNSAMEDGEPQPAKRLHFDKSVSTSVRAQLEQLGPITTDSMSPIISQGMRIRDILGMEKESRNIFVRYEDGSCGRVPMLVLRTFESEKLTDFFAAQLWDVKD